MTRTIPRVIVVLPEPESPTIPSMIGRGISVLLRTEGKRKFTGRARLAGARGGRRRRICERISQILRSAPSSGASKPGPECRVSGGDVGRPEDRGPRDEEVAA